MPRSRDLVRSCERHIARPRFGKGFRDTCSIRPWLKSSERLFSDFYFFICVFLYFLYFFYIFLDFYFYFFWCRLHQVIISFSKIKQFWDTFYYYSNQYSYRYISCFKIIYCTFIFSAAECLLCKIDIKLIHNAYKIAGIYLQKVKSCGALPTRRGREPATGATQHYN